jgi:signal transduction histidine kinase/ActR/RegA family two-component response regulator
VITRKAESACVPARVVGWPPLWKTFALLCLVYLSGCARFNQVQTPIRTIGAIQRLPEREIANGRKVELNGVVTLFDPGWRLLAIQDNTGGVLVDWPPLERNLQIGDRVEVRGATSIDNHVLSIVTALVRVLGEGVLPTPQVTSAASVACGEILYRVVQIEFSPDEGAIGDSTHTAQFTTRQRCNELVVVGRLLRQYSPARLAGHRIRIRGVPLAFYSPSGQVNQVRLMFEDDSDVDVLDPPAPDDGSNQPPRLPEMKSVQAVKALSRTEAARGYPVQVEGVVTAPINPRHDGYFLQEGSTGICVFAPRGTAESLRAGQRVRVIGNSEKGGFAPVIRQSSLQLLGNASLPVPVKIDPGDVFHGWEENTWAEIDGLATGVSSDGQTNQLELFAGPKRLLVWFSEQSTIESLTPLIGSRVQARGVYSPLYTASGDLAGFRLFAPSMAMLKVVERPPAQEEFRTIASLSQFDPRGLPRFRFRTAGVVTYRDSSGRLYLQDGESSLQVAGIGAGDPPLNSWATLDGFLSPEGGTPRMEHVRWLGAKPGAIVAVKSALAESLASGELAGRLVSIEGFLEDRHTSGGELQLEFVSGRSRFTARMEAPGSADAFPDLRLGALLRLTGVATVARQNSGGLLAPSLWLRDQSDIAVLGNAPWWDLRRALYAASAASLLLVIMLAWVARLRHNLVVEMARRSSLEEQLLHAQKLESVGRLAGGVAHDFNNYLTVVLGYTSLLLDQFPENGLIRSQLNTIREVGEKTASLTRQLLAFSRKQVMQPVPSDLNEIISNAKSTLLPLIGEHIEIVMNLGDVDYANIDPAQFMQVLVNLAVNARDAMPEGGKLIFETMNLDLGPREVKREYGLQPGRYACVTVSDTGLGMDRATRERIFEPFFTTKESGHGTGLGLAVVFGVVKQSKGHIQVQSKPGLGSRFRIYLPIAKQGPPASQERQSQRRERAGSETILVVEDQTAVRQLVSSALQENGYRVVSAPSPKQALSILENTAISIDLLLTDLVMPEMSGRLLAAEAAVKRPGMRVLYMSGHSEEIIASQDPPGERIECLEKPFTANEIAAAVRRVLDGVAVS